jgi:3-hydroxy-3-methylglutaryl CoA synthase
MCAPWTAALPAIPPISTKNTENDLKITENGAKMAENGPFSLAKFDYFVAHAPYNKLVRKAYARLEERAGVEGCVAGWGVAVAGWQWDRWKEEVKAVRMVVVRAWQWQY